MEEIFIYVLIDPLDNLVKYVGQTKNIQKRYTSHLNDKSNTLKSSWIKSLKSQNLKPILELIDAIPLKDYIFWEQFYISLFKSWGFVLKNMTDGGDGSYGVVPWNKGKKGLFKHSEKSKKQMSISQKGIPKNVGRKHSDITRKKLSLIHKGRKYKKILLEDNKNCKKIYSYNLKGDLVKIYNSGRETENDGFDSGQVSKVCKGKRKTHKNMIFSFEEIIFDDDTLFKITNKKNIKGIFKHSDKSKEKMSLNHKSIDNKKEKNPSSKKVFCYDLELNLIKKYSCIREVSDDGFTFSIVSKRCNKNDLNPYKKHIFSFIEIIKE